MNVSICNLETIFTRAFTSESEHKMGSKDAGSIMTTLIFEKTCQLYHLLHGQAVTYFSTRTGDSHTWTCNGHHCFCRVLEAVATGDVQLWNNSKCFVGSAANFILLLVSNRTAAYTCTSLMRYAQLFTATIVVHAWMICSWEQVNKKKWIKI